MPTNPRAELNSALVEYEAAVLTGVGIDYARRQVEYWDRIVSLEEQATDS